MSITLYFKENILYIQADDNECTMEDYSNTIWNESVLELKSFGIQKDTLSQCAINYGKKISEIKELVKPFGIEGLVIIKEITKIATKHLIFVMEEIKNLNKTIKGSGFVWIEK